MAGLGRRGEEAVDVLHVDMDAFFASVEVRADPSLRGRPVVVGGTGPRGVVASASYEARRFGVHSAMAVGEARRHCPGIVLIAPRHDEYAKVSEQLMGIFRSVTPLVEPISLDEAYLDVSGAHALFGSSLEIARYLRRRVGEETELECAIGIGHSKLVAKLASKAAKPRAVSGVLEKGEGIVVVEPAAEQGFLRAHPVRSLPGVGPKTAERLRRAGVATVGDLDLLSRERLVEMFGRSHGGSLSDLASGVDERPIEPARPMRSIGREETFDVDDFDLVSLRRKARALSASVLSRCRSHAVVGRTISIKVRYADFETVVRSRTTRQRFDDAATVASAAVELLEGIDMRRGVRLLGVSVSSLEAASGSGAQLGLFSDQPDDAGRRGVGAALAADAVRRRFGGEAITSASAARTAPFRQPDRRGPTAH